MGSDRQGALIQGMLSPSKDDLWVVVYQLPVGRYELCKMEKDHYVVINVYHVTALVHLMEDLASV